MVKKTTLLYLAPVLLLLAGGPCWGQRLPVRRASTARPSTPARTAPPAPTDDFPGQIRPDFVASVLPTAAAVVTPRVSSRAAASATKAAPAASPAAPGIVPTAADLQQIDYLKGKMQLGMPLEPDERAYLLLWMQQHPRQPKPTTVK